MSKAQTTTVLSVAAGLLIAIVAWWVNRMESTDADLTRRVRDVELSQAELAKDNERIEEKLDRVEEKLDNLTDQITTKLIEQLRQLRQDLAP